MPRGQRNNQNADSAEKKTRTVRPRLTDEEKAIAEVEKLRPRVKATEAKLKDVRAKAAALDEELKADQKLLTWALQNPFLPTGYADQADVPQGDAPTLTAVGDEDGDTSETGDSNEGSEPSAEQDDLPGADAVSQAAEERLPEQPTEADDDDPFAGH